MGNASLHKVLICDLVGLKFDGAGKPDPSEVQAHIESRGGLFHLGGEAGRTGLAAGKIHFFYLPDISTEAEILPITDGGQYDAVIAAATLIPRACRFALGGVRIGTGTGNMASDSWGGGNGTGGEAVLMNTPSFNSRATAQMAMKALLHFLPDLPIEKLHQMSVSGAFDTGKNLRDFPTEKLEGKTIGIIGYGNIGRELALLASAFGMTVKVHARPRHREWIESEGFIYAPDVVDAATGADVLSLHTGLGAKDATTGRFANEHLVSTAALSKLNHGAVVLNFDRGECLDAAALGDAMASGQVRFAAIDADVFKSGDGKLSGPLAPYLPLAAKFGARLLLLPHAAADTDHPSRVAGAKQAVDQIFDLIEKGEVSNLKGDLPTRYRLVGPKTVPGVGRVSFSALQEIAADREVLDTLLENAKAMAAHWAGLKSAGDKAEAASFLTENGRRLMLELNRYQALLRRLGLAGPLE